MAASRFTKTSAKETEKTFKMKYQQNIVSEQGCNKDFQRWECENFEENACI